MLQIVALFLLIAFSFPACGQQYFSAPPYQLQNQTMTDANQMMANYQRIISDGNTVFANFQSQITAASGQAIPSGAILPFNLNACPAGFQIADGTGGTPDLRGYFIKIVSTGPGGTYQASTFLSHSHPVTGSFIAGLNFASQYFNSGSAYRAVGVSTGGATGNVTGIPAANIASETRPRNVALLYCMKS
jgi:hypothetical protein